jgi:hypothetical protein
MCTGERYDVSEVRPVRHLSDARLVNACLVSVGDRRTRRTDLKSQGVGAIQGVLTFGTGTAGGTGDPDGDGVDRVGAEELPSQAVERARTARITPI